VFSSNPAPINAEIAVPLPHPRDRIGRVLEERPSHQAPRSRFLEELEDHLSTRDAEHTLTAVSNWGRYAEIFSYGHRQRLFRLPS
jgi:NitT/TauT family transport system ATP-binding protein